MAVNRLIRRRCGSVGHLAWALTKVYSDEHSSRTDSRGRQMDRIVTLWIRLIERMRRCVPREHATVRGGTAVRRSLAIDRMRRCVNARRYGRREGLVDKAPLATMVLIVRALPY